MAIETYFKNIADAIREKAGTSGLITPAQMPGSIINLPSGGSIEFLTPLATDLDTGYVNGNSFIYSGTTKPNVRTDVYKLTLSEYYIAALGSTVSNRFRIVRVFSNPARTTSDLSGSAVYFEYENNPEPYSVAWFIANFEYLAITKSVVGMNNIPTYVCKVRDIVGGS